MLFACRLLMSKFRNLEISESGLNPYSETSACDTCAERILRSDHKRETEEEI